MSYTVCESQTRYELIATFMLELLTYDAQGWSFITRGRVASWLMPETFRSNLTVLCVYHFHSRSLTSLRPNQLLPIRWSELGQTRTLETPKPNYYNGGTRQRLSCDCLARNGMNRTSIDAAGVAELPVVNVRKPTKADAGNATTAQSPDDYEYPDGGFRAWSQVVAANLLNTLCWGMAISFGVSQLHYTETLGLPSSQVSWIGSVQLFLTFGTCAVSGRLTDAGYARATSVAGCFLAVLGLFMASIAQEYWQIFMSQGVCLGLGLGLMFMPAVSIVNSYFKRKRSFALTLAAMGAGIGGLVFPSTVQFLTPQIGFPWALRCAGFVALVIAVIANLLLRPRLAPRRTGPLVEWTAFRELPYVLFLLGAFLYFYALYFSFFYVSVLWKATRIGDCLD